MWNLVYIIYHFTIWFEMMILIYILPFLPVQPRVEEWQQKQNMKKQQVKVAKNIPIAFSIQHNPFEIDDVF